MKLKPIVIASLVALTSLSSQAGIMFDGGDHGSFKAAIAMPVGLFDDTYAFTLGTASSLTATFASSGVRGALTLFNADDTPTAFSWGVGGPSFSVSDTFALTAGSYYYAVSGRSTGAYSLTSTAVAAIPEPETYAMLLAGLGIVAFVARRRRAD